MPLSEGSRIGPYEVIAPLGAGGMGEVWRAKDPRLDRFVAIKVLPDEVSGDAARVARFHAEARAASALNHPNIVTIHDVGKDGGRTYLAMELLEGVSLRQLLDGGRPSLPKALQIAGQIAEGLAAAHARGIVHRDLKPENVFLTTDGVVKILDFGLAKVSPLTGSVGPGDDTLSAVPETSPGALLGTIGYMSPEQASGGAVDFRSDQFAFGTIFYELVTGRSLWKRRTPAETLAAILRDDPPPLATADKAAVPAIRRILDWCLAKDPAARYDSTRDLVGDVRYAAGHSSGAAPASDARAPGDAPRPVARRRVLVAILGATAIAALVALLAIVRVRARSASIGSLAVLPFASEAKDPDSDYLSDGVTESLIDQMSRLPALRVMARATVFRFKGAADALEAGRRLGVGAVLTGRISRRAGILTVSSELVEVATGARLWAETYDVPVADVLRVQNLVAHGVASGLRLRLSPPELGALERRLTENADAYDLFLRARSSFFRNSEAGYQDANRLLARAIAKDPGFAEAHCWLAATFGLLAVDGYMDPREAFARHDEEVRKALALRPDLPLARLMRAKSLFFHGWDWDGAEREFRSLEESRNPVALDFRVPALLAWSRGRLEEAIAVMERARRVDPWNLAYAISAADYLQQAGRLDEAIALYRAAVEDEPSNPSPRFGLAESLRRKGDIAGAIGALAKAYELSEEPDGVRALAAARTERDYAKARAAVAHARLADLLALAAERYVSPLELARLEADVGNGERAIAYLEKAFEERSPGLVFLKADPAWARIRGDPRFASLVLRVGIP